MRFKVISIILFLTCFSLNGNTQEWETVQRNLIYNLSQLRTQILVKDTISINRMKKLLTKIDNLGIEDDELPYFKMILYHSAKRHWNYEKFRNTYDKTIKRYKGRKKYKRFDRFYKTVKISEEDYQTLLFNLDLLWLFEFNIFQGDFPFKITNSFMFEHIEFFDIQFQESIGFDDVYDGSLPRLIYIMGLENEVYISEEYKSNLEHNKKGIAFLNKYYFTDKIHVSLTTSKKINIPKKVDKIILDNCFRSYDHKEKKLKSAYMSLKEEGILIISEFIHAVGNIKPDAYSLTEKEFLGYIDPNKFELIESKEVGRMNLYKFRKVN